LAGDLYFVKKKKKQKKKTENYLQYFLVISKMVKCNMAGGLAVAKENGGTDIMF